MAHSCRWRFPARPGGSSNSGTGRRAGRIRVTASLQSSTGVHPNTAGLGPGFDAALQVSAAIDSNLQKFRDVLGESSGSSSGEEEVFSGFGIVTDNRRIQSPGRTPTATPTPERKPRGRPPRALTVQRVAPGPGSSPQSVTSSRGETEGSVPPTEKVKRPPGRPPGSGERRRGRPPASGSQRGGWLQGNHALPSDGKEVAQEPGSTPAHRKDVAEDDKEKKGAKRIPLGSVQQQESEVKLSKVGRDAKVTKLKRLRDVKLSPLKSRLKAIVRKGVPIPGVPRRRRGRPPSAERLKAEAAAAAQAAASSVPELLSTEAGTAKQKAFRVRRERDLDPHTPLHLKLRASHPADECTSPDPHGSPSAVQPASPPRLGRPMGLRQSPRHIKPVRIVPPSKRTDATIAKQLLQRAKKGAQKKKLFEKEAVAGGTQGAAGMEAGIRRRRRTQLKNIRQFIMPVVSTVSLRIIKTPKRFIEDEGSFGTPPPHMKMARLDTAASAAAPPPQPTTSTSPTLVSTASVSAGAAAVSGAGPAVDTLPPPPPPVPVGVNTVTAGLLNNSSCNNSTSNGRFSSSAASCGSSAVSQHSSQLSSGESSRSSSPSLDDSSCDSQASEGTQALSEEPDQSPSSQGEQEVNLHHASHPPSPPSEPEPEHMGLLEPSRRGRRGQGLRRGGLVSRGRGSLISGKKKTIISPATGVLISSSQAASQQASSTASSSSSPPPPPLITPPQPLQSASSNTPSISEHHPHSAWIMPHTITPFLPTAPVLPSHRDKHRSILREPTFRWTSLSRTEQQYFSSAKYAKEGLIRKPIFDNFRPPPLTAEDVGLMPPGPGGGSAAQGGFPTPSGGAGAGTRLFSPLHHHHHHQHPSARFEPPHQKRSPLLRAPRFTPSAAHSRIFESVTLPFSSGSSPGSLSPLHASSTSSRTLRRRKKRAFGLTRGQPRSPSHSMTRRSSQSGGQTGKSPSDLAMLTSSVSSSTTSNSSPLPGVAVSPLAASALTQAPFSTFSQSSMGLSSHGATDGRRAAGGLGVGGSSASPASSQLFPLFASSPQTQSGSSGKAGRERSLSTSRDAAPKEKERETDKSREREKENKKEGRKDWEKRGKGLTSDAPTNSSSGLFAGDGKDAEESLIQKKTPGRKKSVSVDSGAEASPVDSNAVQSGGTFPLSKGRLSKKGRPLERGLETEGGEKNDKERLSGPIQATGNPSTTTTSLGTVLAQAEKQPVTDRRVAGLLKKAKAQLYKIEKSKSMKTMDQPKVQGQESDSSETSVRGPRIKHVCRRAAVALGRDLAVFPDNMPTLSALPWEEREKILSSMGNDDKSSVAGSEEAEPPTPPIKPVTRHKPIQEAPPRKGRRSRRCGQCPGCQVPEDCGVCTNCLDKPKFGGRNIKKQCCKVRKCQNLQWMPSKMFLQKQGKGKKDKKKNKNSEKKEAHNSVKCQGSEASSKPASPSSKDEPPRKKSDIPAPKAGEPQQSPPSPTPAGPKEPYAPLSPASAEEAKQPPASSSAHPRKDRKQCQPSPPSSSPHTAPSSPPAPAHQPMLQQQQSKALAKKETPAKSPPTDPKKRFQQQTQTTAITDTGPEAKQMRNQTSRSSLPPKPKPKEKEKQMATKPDSSTLNFLSTPSTGGLAKQRAPCDGVHRIRVDFKQDCDVENVWEMGGLSILTSVPITPRVVCFLCASSGNVEFVFCQVCCEPFHLFCLGETERPLEEQWENWCCRRCRFCHVCGRQHQKTKQLLECDKCRNSYHPECLGPNYPTTPTKKKRVWICTKCVRCKSCGATKPGKTWDAQWSHDFSLCHECAKLFAKGNFCPLCDKCYDDDDYESKMMQCGKCNHWVHAKCESLSDEMYELLSSLPESVAYTCVNCTECQPAEWRSALEKKIQSCVRQVLTALLNSRTSTHLLRYRQAVMKPPELNPETEESLPSRRSPEGPDPPVLTEVSPPSDSPLDLESVEKKMDLGSYNSVLEFSDDIVKIIQTAINSDGGQPENKKANSMVKSFFIRQMQRVFPWFKVKESKFWETPKISTNSGLLPNAVLPPSLDHNYAQWQERQEIARAEQPLLMKKIIPAPRPKGPEEPDSPTAPPLPPPPPIHIPDLNPEDSPDVLPPPPGVNDNRQCVLCLNYGDENTNDGGRLLYIGQNEWTHVNCALWSAEVFEDDDGSLKNVHMAVIRGKQLRCENCQRPGATVGCCLTSCTSNYHFMCARQCHCVFLEDKKVYCQRHRNLIKGEVVSESGFEVTRRISVDFEGISLRRKFLNGLESDKVHMMIGSMTIDCLGMLTELSDCERKLFPIGYQCSRVYWSTLDARKRCVYTCRILMCCPPVAEPVITSKLAQEENYTTIHSPPHVSEVDQAPMLSSCDATKLADQQPVHCTPKPKVYSRNRHPSYPPFHRPPTSRPLPTPGDFSNSSHEVVTVGDPLLGSSLRSIGSRRHSTSSLSPQISRESQKVSSPPLGGILSSQTGVPSAGSSLNLFPQERGVRDPEKGRLSTVVRSQSWETSSVSPGTQHRQHLGFPEKGEGSREIHGKISEGENVKTLTTTVMSGVSQVSPPLGTAVLTGHQRTSCSSKVDKGKQKDTDVPTGVTLLSSHPLANLPKDRANPMKEGNMTSVSAPKEAGKSGSPQPLHHKSGGRKPQDYLSGPAPAAAMKPLWSSGASAGEEEVIKRGSQASLTSHGTSTTKDKHSKVKMPSKGREKTPQNNKSPVLNSNSKGGDVTTLGQVRPSQNSKNRATSFSSNSNNRASGAIEANEADGQGGEKPFKLRDRYETEKKPSSALEGPQPKTSSERRLRPSHVQTKISKEGIPRERRSAEKLSPLTQKMDPNGTKVVSSCSNTNTAASISIPSLGPGNPRRSSQTMPVSPSASSESSESDSHPNPDDCEEHLMDRHCVEDDGEDHNLEDESCVDKHHEEDSDGSSSAKRRYPRRSARARSNMFFGLTPFYGVRSYGEEDIPLYSAGDVAFKKRSGSSKRSAEGQVDGADDMTTSSSGDSGEDEEGGIRPNKASYYYNFTRTIINPNSELPPIEGIDQCPGRGVQISRFLREEVERNEADIEESVAATMALERQQIGQLDGVDDGSESDASVSTSSTTTATTSTHKGSAKKKGRESRAEKLAVDSGKEAGNGTSGGGVNNRDVRKNQKDNCVPLGGVKSQGQDPLDTQLSLTSDLLKSDSDNNNSDDCGNILPSEIMDFVLNTPSMQALGQQTENPSSELLSLDEGYGVIVNRRKDILFEDFPQPLSSTEPVESGVSSITVEEPYGIPLELPSDLSVLTTRSPTVNNQNHNSLISETSDRTMLALATDESGAEKSRDKQREGSVVSSESPHDGHGDSQVSEGHMTPEQFIPSRIEGDHISSPGVGQVVETGNQDLSRTSGTPCLPSSPTMPLQAQKFIPVASVSSSPSPVASSTVQATASHLKPGPEKLIVLNQHLQPLYVLQTLSNGVTQKIQIAPSVSSTGVMNTSPPVLAGLSAGISTSQPIFSASGKGLVPMSHHPQIHAFTSTTQTSFQPVIPSTTSGLLIGVPSHEPHIVVSEAGHRHDLQPSVAMVSSASSISPTPAVLTTGHGKKRPISRLQPRKSKKLARSRSQPTLAPSEVGSNMTLINLSPPQITAGIPTQSGLVEVGTITTATTSQRKIPNIIKRPKSGVMYFEPTLLQQGLPISTTAQPGILGHDTPTHVLPCTVPRLNPNQSVLNVVSMPSSGPGNILGAGSVSLSTPGLIGSTEITGPISNLVFKTSPHNLGLPEQQMVLHSGASMMSQLSSPAQTSIASSICVLPPNQTIMSVNQQGDQEGTLHVQHQVSRVLTDKTQTPDCKGNSTASLTLAPNSMTPDLNKGHVVGVFTQSSRTTPISRASNQHQAIKSTTVAASNTPGKGKQKAKRARPNPDKTTGGKKHKGLQPDVPAVVQGVVSSMNQASSKTGGREPFSPEPMDTGKSIERGSNKSDSTARTAEASSLTHKSLESQDEKPNLTGRQGQGDGKGSNTLLVATPDKEDNRRDSAWDYKPKKGLIFEISSDDGFQIRCESIEEAWKSLTDKVQEARSNARLKALSFDGVSGLRMLGVLHDAVVFLLEQLYGARHCHNYRFRFHKPEEPDEPPINPHGSARAEQHHRRSMVDMFNFLASKHRQPPEYNPQDDEEEEVQLKSARRATSMDLPMPMRFRHLRTTSREAVGVYRSAIHGRGLFCKRNIDAGEMVIEYAGNVIRSVLTDKREKYYDSKGIGCYMFRIDDHEVVDATMHGNAARFINHSCEPNCYSRVVGIDGQKHIVIFAMRKIYRGEELTYDYKFPIEEPGNKLPCKCGAKKCRKFLN